jgi:hypothetical protein
MARRILSLASNAALAVSLALAGYVLVSGLVASGGRFFGTCLVGPHRTLLVVALGLALASLALSFFEPRKAPRA